MRSQARAEAAPGQSLQRRSRKSASARETQAREEMEAGSCSGSTNQCAALAKSLDCSCFGCSGRRFGDQFSDIFLSSIVNDHTRLIQGNRDTDYRCSSRKEHRRLAVRKPERRQRKRLLRRRRPGRDSDALIQDRRFEGHLAQIDTTVSEQTRKSLRDRKAAWRG